LTTAASDVHSLVSVRSVALHRVRIPLNEPFRISSGSVDEKDSILVEVVTQDGSVGWGEASPMSGSFYSDETPDTGWESLINCLIPKLFESDHVDPRRFFESLRELTASPFAKAGLEGALWDAYAQRCRRPLCELLGAQARPVPSGVAIGIFERVDQLFERVALYVDQGYQRVKIKIQPGWDIVPVAAVRERFPKTPLMVDANGAYTLDDKEIFQELDAFDLMMIEQPLAGDAHLEAGELQALLRTPLCADESADTLISIASIIKHRAARILNVKVQRVGGLSESLLMLEAARTAGLECWVGTMPELGVASAQALHLATHSGFTCPTDVEASLRWYVDDVVEPLIAIDRAGFIHLPEGAGTGYQVSRAKVERYSIAVERFEL
jgi:o-succinylbenzoate synthase